MIDQSSHENLNPYGQVPLETQDLVEDVLKYSKEIENIVPKNTGCGGIDIGEAIAGADNTDENLLRINMSFFHKTREGEKFDEIHSFALYNNGIGIVTYTNRLWHGYELIEEKLISQRFLRTEDIGCLRLLQPFIR